jgi:Fis family transcriptional regulator
MAARKDNASLVKRSQPAGSAAGRSATAIGANRAEQNNATRGAMNGVTHESARPHRVPVAATAAAQPAEQAGESLEQCVFRSLDQYFSDLAGAKPHALHEMVLGAIEKPLLQFALQRCEGNQSAAADLLGINRNTLRRKLQDYGLH